MNNYYIGHSDGSGYGKGTGYGYSRGDGYDNGYGGYDGYSYSESGYGDVLGHGNGYGVGYGHNCSNGGGYGHHSPAFSISAELPWKAYHYIAPDGDGFKTRNGWHVDIGEVLYMPSIEMHEYGLRASISAKDAALYAPDHSVLTEVEVWGQIVIDRYKLVATHWRIVRRVEDNTNERVVR